MHPTLRLLCTLPLVFAACRAPATTEDPAPLASPVRPLSAILGQRVLVAPLNHLREVDALGWTQQIPRSREFMRAFDDAFEAELVARGLKGRWVFADALVQAGRGSPSYAVDPYALAATPLRGEQVVADTRIGDPLATQLRTMIALQEAARLVLIPLELRFDKLADGRGLALLRLAVVDARLGEVRWIGDVRSAPTSTFSREILTNLAAHSADLIAAP